MKLSHLRGYLTKAGEILSLLNGIEVEIDSAIHANGLALLGWFVHEGQAGLLIGNHGSAMWRSFSGAPEYADGKENPMNRWTQRVVGQVAGKLPMRDRIDAISFPFGVPVYPFQQWAKMATGNRPSPLGILIDPEYGLWWALRAAILFDDRELVEAIDTSKNDAVERRHPCDGCPAKPCLSVCPVRAFGNSSAEEEIKFSLDVARCRSHLDSSAKPDCMRLGCRARAICPVGYEHQYLPEQLQFHMEAFKG